jgi:hypothetical protein
MMRIVTKHTGGVRRKIPDKSAGAKPPKMEHSAKTPGKHPLFPGDFSKIVVFND